MLENIIETCIHYYNGSVVMIVGLGIVLYMIAMSEDVSQNNMELQDALIDLIQNDNSFY